MKYDVEQHIEWNVHFIKKYILKCNRIYIIIKKHLTFLGIIHVFKQADLLKLSFISENVGVFKLEDYLFLLSSHKVWLRLLFLFFSSAMDGVAFLYLMNINKYKWICHVLAGWFLPYCLVWLSFFWHEGCILMQSTCVFQFNILYVMFMFFEVSAHS